MREKRHFVGLIAVAGLSARMNDFKPFLPLAGRTVVENTVLSLKNAGISEVVAVVGHRGDEVADTLKRYGVTCVKNPRYAETGMFESVALGLSRLAHADAVLVLPGDVPLVRRHSLRALTRAFLQTGAPVICPAYRGRRGHPPLIAHACIPQILAYDGHQGLRGALETYADCTYQLDLPDPFLVMDADTPEDYERLLALSKRPDAPDAGVCAAILEWAGTPARSVAHSRVVAQTAVRLAELLDKAGRPADLPLTLAGGLLHDVAKGGPRHPERGARMMRVLGYPAVAEIVAAHNDPPREAVEALDARALVFLADKLVIETEVRGIEARFARAMEKHGNAPGAAANIGARKAAAREVADRVAAAVGADFWEIQAMLQGGDR